MNEKRPVIANSEQAVVVKMKGKRQINSEVVLRLSSAL